MQLTKYEHACFTVEKDNKTVVVDPGSFTTDFIVPENVVVIIITHEHGDHFELDLMNEIVDKNPEVVIMGPADVTAKLGKFNTRTVHSGDSITFEGFEFDFYGDTHAVIYKDIPTIQNIGVLIDDRIYYPGDSFTIPEKTIDTLALPVAAPWLKIADSIEFMNAVGARLTFPTHDAILSPEGKNITDRLVSNFTEVAGTEYRRIDGEMIDIA